MRVLIVEDERKTANFIRRALSAEGFAIAVCHDGNEAGELALNCAFDVIVLDIMLPGCDGLAVLRRLRERGGRAPVLLLSARGQVNERVEGLRAGADDYLPKPFALDELVARVQALARRAGDTQSIILRVGDLVLDTGTHKGKRGVIAFDLTAHEFRLLEYLMRSTGRVCSRMNILEKVWDYGYDPGTNVVDVYIKRLRDKFDAPFSRKLLHSVRGIGYTLKEEA